VIAFTFDILMGEWNSPIWNGGVLNIFRGLDTMAENLEFSLRCVDALSSKALSLMTEVTIENYY
jgi:hypothetical protein